MNMTMTIEKIFNRTIMFSMIIAVLGVLPFFSTTVSAETSMRDEVDATRATLEKWVETKSIISQEKKDWALGKDLLSERIGIELREIESLQNKIADAEKSVTEANEKRVELIKENDNLKETSAVLRETVAALEKRTMELLKGLPDTIAERIKPLSQRFPKNAEDTKLSLGERFQNVIGVLNEINKFNGTITITSEVRQLPNSASAEVTAVYIGLGQAYYANNNSNVAGIGMPSKDGWVWIPQNEAAPEIAKAIAILKNEMAATFVQLPMSIQ
ncbi:MAG: DUF3450 family protein [Candidatus Omnitrophota bacterium]